MEQMAAETFLKARFIAVNMSNQQIDVFEEHTKMKTMEHYRLNMKTKLEDFLDLFRVTKIPHKVVVSSDGYIRHNGPGDVTGIVRSLVRNNQTFSKKTKGTPKPRRDVDDHRPDSSNSTSTAGGTYSRGSTPATPAFNRKPGSPSLTSPPSRASFASRERSDSKLGGMIAAVKATKQVTTRRSKEKAREREREAAEAAGGGPVAKRMSGKRDESPGDGSRRQSTMAPRLMGENHTSREMAGSRLGSAEEEEPKKYI